MSAVLAGGIEGVSARYAAQIRELLHVQAMKRLAAEQEAARRAAEAEEAARLEAIRTALAPSEPVKVDVEIQPAAELAEPVRQPEAKEPAPVPPAQIFDEQA
jgi:hypothetical protein